MEKCTARGTSRQFVGGLRIQMKNASTKQMQIYIATETSRSSVGGMRMEIQNGKLF